MPDMMKLKGGDKEKNLQLAFDAAHEWWDVPYLLDAKDIAYADKIDEKSIQTYVATLYGHMEGDEENPGVSEEKKRKIQEKKLMHKQAAMKYVMTELKAAEFGVWELGSTAGGNPFHFEYRKNPKFELHVASEGNVLKTVNLRVEIRSVGESIGEGNSVGVQVLRKDSNAVGGYFDIPFNKKMVLVDGYSANNVVSESGESKGNTGDNQDPNSFVMDFTAETNGAPLVVIPSTFYPANGKFEISVCPCTEDENVDFLALKSVKLEVKEATAPFPFRAQFTASGKWQIKKYFGGQHDLPSWRFNPQYCMRIERTTLLSITLTQPNAAEKNSISFDIVRNHGVFF